MGGLNLVTKDLSVFYVKGEFSDTYFKVTCKWWFILMNVPCNEDCLKHYKEAKENPGSH